MIGIRAMNDRPEKSHDLGAALLRFEFLLISPLHVMLIVVTMEMTMVVAESWDGESPLCFREQIAHKDTPMSITPTSAILVMKYCRYRLVQK